jgi:diaminopimelate dehydrogenase
MDLRASLDSAARTGGSVAVISAGWDPGTDSVVRVIMETIAPRGITSTNFGPGMSMGHTVAIKALEGVEDALSITIPIGTGLHRRMIYVKTKPGYEFDEVTARIKADPYFSHDECWFYPADNIEALQDMGHGVHMERKGVSGASHNQRMEFIMSVMNPAATAQVMVSGLDPPVSRMLHSAGNSAHRLPLRGARRAACTPCLGSQVCARRRIGLESRPSSAGNAERL